MSLFSRPRDTPPGPVARLWSDRTGRLATRSLQALIVIAIVAVVIFALTRVPLLVIPVLIALIFASALSPLVDLLQRAHIPRVLGTVLVLLLALAVLGGVGWFIYVSVRDQGGELIASAQDGIDQFVGWLTSLGVGIDQIQFDDVRQRVVDFVTSARFGTGALAGVSAVADLLTGLAVMVVTLFFFLLDGRRIWAFLLRPFEGEGYARARRVGRAVTHSLGSYLRGTAIVAAADSLLIGVGLFAVGVPLVVPLIAIIFFTAFIPIVGALIAGLLAATLALVANGPVAALIIVAVVIAVNQIDGNVLQPLVQGSSLKLHPLAILLALTAGTVLGGLAGTLLAVPIVAAAWAAVVVWDGPDTPAWFARKKRPEPR
ncbi:MAG: AI-2E family transporter [Actinomycetales bacterium]|nr:AI-2E family transporter [Actinomycetales bacterium]